MKDKFDFAYNYEMDIEYNPALLELKNIELENYLNKEIIDNPFLEKDDEANEEDLEENFFAENQTNQISIEDEIQISNKESPIDDETNIFDVNYNSENSEITNFLEETLSFKKSLNESLIDQVNLNFRDDLDKKVAFLLICLLYTSPSPRDS